MILKYFAISTLFCNISQYLHYFVIFLNIYIILQYFAISTLFCNICNHYAIFFANKTSSFCNLQIFNAEILLNSFNVLFMHILKSYICQTCQLFKMSAIILIFISFPIVFIIIVL